MKLVIVSKVYYIDCYERFATYESNNSLEFFSYGWRLVVVCYFLKLNKSNFNNGRITYIGKVGSYVSARLCTASILNECFV